jgi:hypothetical protein
MTLGDGIRPVTCDGDSAGLSSGNCVQQEAPSPLFALEMQQPELFELLRDGRELLLEDEQATKVFTGEHVARNRARFAGILRCLGEGMSQSAISRAFGVSRNTLAAIISRNPQLVEQERRLAAGRFAVLARACSERLLEQVDTMALNVAMVTMGIATEKSLLLDGRPTAITESKKEHAGPADINAYLDRLASARPSADSQSDAQPTQPVEHQPAASDGVGFGVGSSGRGIDPGPDSKGGGGGRPSGGGPLDSMG